MMMKKRLLSFGMMASFAAQAQTEARRYLFETWPRIEAAEKPQRILKDELDYRQLLTGYRRLTERLRVFTKELEGSADPNCQGAGRLAAAAILEDLDKKNKEIQEVCRSNQDSHPEACFKLLGLYPDLELRLLRFERSLEKCVGDDQSRKWLDEVEGTELATKLSVESALHANPRSKEVGTGSSSTNTYVKPAGTFDFKLKTDQNWLKTLVSVWAEPGTETDGMQLGFIGRAEGVQQLGSHSLRAGAQVGEERLWVPEPQSITRAKLMTASATAGWRWLLTKSAFELAGSFSKGVSNPDGASFTDYSGRSSFVFSENSYQRQEFLVSFSQHTHDDWSFFPKAQGVGLAYAISGQIYSGGSARALGGVVERREDFKRARLYPWLEVSAEFLAPLSVLKLPVQVARLGIFTTPGHGEWSATQIETGAHAEWEYGNGKWSVPFEWRVFQRASRGQPSGIRDDFVGSLSIAPSWMLAPKLKLTALAMAERSYLLKREALTADSSLLWVARSSYATWKLGGKVEYAF